MSSRSRLTAVIFAATLVPAALAAQSPATVQAAVKTITPADVIRRIGIIADDSMLGRATPSPQIELTARYIAGEFKKFGLKPGGDSGSYIQHYPILRQQIDLAQSTLTVAGHAATPVVLRLGTMVNYVTGALPTKDVSGPVSLVLGTRDSVNPMGGADVRGRWLVQVVTATPQGVTIDFGPIAAAFKAGALGVLFVSNRADAQWQNRLGRMTRPGLALGGMPVDPASGPLVEIRDPAASAALGLDAATLRTVTAPATPPVVGVTITLHIAQVPTAPFRAPNTIGILEGSDPTLKNEYVFMTGHMDHIGTPSSGEGCQAQGADSICNGADDDASGSIGVVMLAQAFSQLRPRPKRSLVFMTVSGEERGLWGSAYYVEHPAVPLAQTVADLNTDMIGRNWKDSIVVIGKEHSDLGATLNRIGVEHPELHMKPTDDIWPDQQYYFRSDHYNFAKKGVPILFFFNGEHPDYHAVGDEVAKIDGEKESRIIQLDFYLALAVANAAERPKWNPASYARIVEKKSNE